MSSLGNGFLGLAVWALAPVFADQPWLTPKRLIPVLSLDAALEQFRLKDIVGRFLPGDVAAREGLECVGTVLS